MSKDVIYPFAEALHIHGLFDGVPIPETPFSSVALSTGLSNTVPQKIDTQGRLHVSVFATSNVRPVTDVVFRVEADVADTLFADNKIKDFIQAVELKLGTGQHMCARRLHKDNVTIYFIRFFFNADFKCKYHPEMQLGEPTRPFMCPVCQTMQITGLPHIEDSSY